jgi:hypothetical protein
MPKNDGKPWTREDIKTLREQARDRNITTVQIAKNLGRTVNAVRVEAQRRKISLKPKKREARRTAGSGFLRQKVEQQQRCHGESRCACTVRSAQPLEGSSISCSGSSWSSTRARAPRVPTGSGAPDLTVGRRPRGAIGLTALSARRRSESSGGLRLGSASCERRTERRIGVADRAIVRGARAVD